MAELFEVEHDEAKKLLPQHKLSLRVTELPLKSTPPASGDHCLHSCEWEPFPMSLCLDLFINVKLPGFDSGHVDDSRGTVMVRCFFFYQRV